MKQLRNYINIRRKPTTIEATDATIQQIVKDELDKFGHDADLNHIDVSEVTKMDNLFHCYDGANFLGKTYSDLNPDISKWDVRNVTHMNLTFYYCEKFNQDLSKWNTENVQYMNSMFDGCTVFNSDISGWDVRKVEYMGGMFRDCHNFNCDIGGWQIDSLIYTYAMFENCRSFNQDLSDWKSSKVKNSLDMFKKCPIKKEFKPSFAQ